MQGFWILSRTMARHYFGLSVLRERLRTRTDLGKTVFPLLGGLVLGTLFLYGYVKLLQSIYTMAAQLQQPGIMVVFGLLTVQLMVLIFGLFYVMSVFYYSSDLEYLVPMPLQAETILAAKFGVVLLTEYATALPLALPPIVMFGLNQGLGFAYWAKSAVVVALLPLLPLAVAAIVAVVLMRTTSLARHRDALRVAAGLFSVVLAVVVNYYTSRMGAQNADPNQVIMGLMAAPNSLVQVVGRRFPPALWGSLALTAQGSEGAKPLLLYLASTVVAVGLLLVVARRYFYKGLLQTATHPHAGKRRNRSTSLALAARSPFLAMLNREWQILARNPIFAMTAGLNLFLPPVLLALPILGTGEQLFDMQMALNNPRFFLWGSVAIAALFGALAPLSSIAPTAISREGKLFWVSRTIPVDVSVQLLAKLAFSVLSVMVSGLLVLLVAGTLLRLPSNIMVAGLVLGLPTLLCTSVLCLMVDVLWPRLNWENPQQAMKGNQNVLAAMLFVAALGYGLARLIIWMAGLGWADATILGSTALVLLAVSLVGIRYLFVMGSALYKPRAQALTGGKSTMALTGFVKKNARNSINVLVFIVVAFFLSQQFIAGRNLEYTFAPDAVRFGKVEIPYNEITEVRYLENVPPLSNRVGTSLGNYHSGTFTVSGIGRGKVVASDATKPALLLRTDKTFYIITPDNASDKYQEVLQKVEVSKVP